MISAVEQSSYDFLHSDIDIRVDNTFNNKLPSVRYENFANNPILIYNEEKSLRTVARHFADYKTIQVINHKIFPLF